MKSQYLILLMSIAMIACEAPVKDEVLLAQSARATENADMPKPFAVVELFTSQGCSSCPPADATLSRIADQAEDGLFNVYALSFHVDYWNYLGWKDPYSQKAFSDRQRWYAETFGRVYTPQIVLNGTQEFVGSRIERPWRELGAELDRSGKVSVELAVSLDGDGKDLGGNVSVDYQLDGNVTGSVLHFALVERNLSTEVKRGENSGRTLEHDNVVRVFQTIENDLAASGSVQLDLPPDFVQSNGMVVAYVQNLSDGAILGANGTKLKTDETK